MHGDRSTRVKALVNAFSPTALVSASIVAATGTVSAWLRLGSVSALWSSMYGRVLLLKLGVLVGVVATGAFNWLRVQPALGTDVATVRLRRSASIELAIGCAVLVVTAILVATPTPFDVAN
ncbi:MAG: CopD family protein [Gemmatimonadaceae bacterium]